MNRDDELKLIDEIGGLLADGTTSMAAAVARVPVANLVGVERTRREREVLFRRYPQVVAPSAALPNPGDFITETVAGIPLLVVRDDEGVVRVMLNVCRHRGNEVTSEKSGNKRMFACVYHAWTYDQRGACRSFVDRNGFEGLDRDDFSLVSYPTEERLGLIWMLPEVDGDLDVREFIGATLDEELAGYLPHMSNLFASDHHREKFNWKFGVNTFQELFHLAFLHKSTLGKSFISNVSAVTSFTPHQRITVVRSTFPEMLTLPEAERDLFSHCSLVYVLFPNVVLTWQLDHVEVWRFTPVEGDDESCEVALWLLTEESASSESAQRHWQRNWDVVTSVVFNEDFATMAKIQHSLSTGELPEIVYGRNEIGLQDYHHNVSAALNVGKESLGE